jgi:twitching motility two-component system response regulator PilH
MKLVVADDDPLQGKLALHRLERDGHQVTLAADGEQALAVIRQVMPDAVISDVVMPKLDGLGLARAMKKDPVLAQIPIWLTTNSQPESVDRDLAKRTGARDLLFRTPDLAEVRAALAAYGNVK